MKIMFISEDYHDEHVFVKGRLTLGLAVIVMTAALKIYTSLLCPTSPTCFNRKCIHTGKKTAHQAFHVVFIQNNQRTHALCEKTRRTFLRTV